jgi:spore germination cell wall hydrolase CwlJ-like protein
MAVDSGSYTPDVIARRKALADALYNKKRQPMTHWMQGVEMLGDNLVGGLLEGKNKRDRQEAGEMQAKMLEQLSAPAAPSAAPASPRPVSMAPTSDKVYASDEPSPLDPPSGSSRDMLARALLAEAGNQGPVGMQAVANVVRNRAASGNFGGDTVEGVLQKPYQFEPFNTAGGRGKMAAMDPNSPRFQEALGAIDRAYAGNDPTMGATHFYAPKAQAALGRPAPKWDNGTGVDIGDHRFFGGAGTPQVTAGASPTDVSAQSRAPQSAPQQPDQRAMIADMLRSKNPYIQQQGQTLAAALLQKQFAAPSYDFKVAGDALYRVDPRKGTADKIGEASKKSWQRTGTDPNTGDPTFGFVDPSNPPQQAAPQAAPQQPMPGATPAVPAPVQIPPPPPGANPKTWRETFTKEAAEKVAGAPQAKVRAKESIDSLFRTGQKALDLSRHEGLDAAVGPISSKLPTFRESTANFETDIENLGTRIFINTINRMRELSKTGGAVGSVTEKEMTKLENAMQNLSLRQGEGNMRKNLSGVAKEINDSMRSIAEAYKQQYGEDLPYQPLELPAEASGEGWQDMGGGVRIREKR